MTMMMMMMVVMVVMVVVVGEGGEGGGGSVPLTVGVDFAAPLLVHVGRVEWVKVSRYM